MNVYLAGPQTQQQAEHLCDMPVLLSYAYCREWVFKGYQQSFARVLIDSGAYSEFSSGNKIDIVKFADWSEQWVGHADAIAGLDDISGDWRRSLANYEAFPKGFPTFHETDPPELLDELVAMARERGRWIAVGFLPKTRAALKGESWLRESCDRIPEDVHVHGWAMRAYTNVRRLDSVDSTNWWRDAMKLRTLPDTQHLHYGECLEIVVKRYKRWERTIRGHDEEGMLFDA